MRFTQFNINKILIEGMIILTMCFSLIGEVFEAKVMTMSGEGGKNEEKLCLEKIVPNKRQDVTTLITKS